MTKEKQILENIFLEAVKAVSGYDAVFSALNETDFAKPDQIVAVGKAAVSMAEAARAKFPEAPIFIATKYDHMTQKMLNDPNCDYIEAAHPTPDESSLKAGKAIFDLVSNMSEDSRLLLLVSGGASAVVEYLQGGVSLDDLQVKTKDMLAKGLDIHAINKERKALSLIKDGKLLKTFKGNQALSFLISDVEGDDVSVIGSGIGDIKHIKDRAQLKLIATNEIARKAAQKAAEKRSLNIVQNIENMYDDIENVAKNTIDTMSNAKDGLYIFGGESTVILPDNPKEGGRNQALALLMAKYIQGQENLHILVGGTDGSDGLSLATGAYVNGQTYHNVGAEQARVEANSGSFFREIGDAIVTGPTGTNVMDLMLVWKKS